MSEKIEIKCYENMEKYIGSEVSVVIGGAHVIGCLFYSPGSKRYLLLHNCRTLNEGNNTYYKSSAYYYYYWISRDDFACEDIEDFYVLNKKRSVLDYSWSMEGLTMEQSEHVQQTMFDNGIGWSFAGNKIKLFYSIQYNKDRQVLFGNPKGIIISFETFIEEFPMKGEMIIESQGVFLVKNNKGIRYEPQLHNCRCAGSLNEMGYPIKNDPENWREINNILNPTNKQELKILKSKRNSIITLLNTDIEII